MSTATPWSRRLIAPVFFLFVCCSVLAADYPPLPKVERTRLTDEELFSKLDPQSERMRVVLETMKSGGIQAGMSALADHFRRRTRPKWWNMASLERMYDYFAYSSVHGQMAAFNDSGHGSVRRLLAEGFESLPERTDFQWLLTGGREGDEPDETNRAFPYAGHYVM